MVLKFITLNDDNAKGYAYTMRKPNKYHAVAYLADWCGHCKDFKPTWENAIKKLKEKKDQYDGYVTTASDKTMHELPCSKPEGFPTLSLYKGTQHINDLKGRTSDDVLNFFENLRKEVDKNTIMEQENKKMKQLSDPTPTQMNTPTPTPMDTIIRKIKKKVSRKNTKRRKQITRKKKLISEMKKKMEKLKKEIINLSKSKPETKRRKKKNKKLKKAGQELNMEKGAPYFNRF